jgi:uncharacterized protein
MMLKVKLRSLEHEDLVLQEKGQALALGVDLDPELCQGSLEVSCNLTKNFDMISAKGWVKGSMLLTCDRCLKEFESPYKSFFEIYYRPKPENFSRKPEEEIIPEGEAEIIYYEGEVVDIAEQVRQTVLLSVPMRALCRDDCRGLCGGCGCDLNVEKCRCTEPPADSRWDALKNIKF